MVLINLSLYIKSLTLVGGECNPSVKSAPQDFAICALISPDDLKKKIE
jgi:hypothetical protein